MEKPLESLYIARGNAETATMGNPVMIVGHDNMLHILYSKNMTLFGGGLWYRCSHDDGLTWSDERRISSPDSALSLACIATIFSTTLSDNPSA